MKIKIPEDRLDVVAHAATCVPAGVSSQMATGQLLSYEDYVRTPGGIRTHTVGGLSTVSLPLEYRGVRVGRRSEA